MQFMFHFQNSLVSQDFTMCDLKVIKNAEASSSVKKSFCCCFTEAELNLKLFESSSSVITHTVLWSHSQHVMSRTRLAKSNKTRKG